MMKNQTVLLIEDDASIREGIRILLEAEGYMVEEAEDGPRGLGILGDKTSIVILDVMMPGISGIRVCKEIRKKSNVPVLFLTAKGEDSDKLLGLEVGGDDYLTKPFSYVELLGRVKAILRRHTVYDQAAPGDRAGQPEWLEAGELRVHMKYNQVVRGVEDINLTEMEYQLLLLFMSRPQKIFSINNLYESIWEEPFGASSGNTVMVHIRRLRKKIEENPQKPRFIMTVWGKGYRFGQEVSKK